ncbi:MAG: PAS/PAC sensor hybrid histidine kinase [Nitrospirae bacterium]|nr:MAG: PAS/PAC sensor hybrid histidine kinase [Nitrospirota bacterium]
MNHKPFDIASIFLLVMLTLPHQTGQAYAQQERGEFLAGVPANFPPHYSIDPQTNKPIGFAIDVMDEVAQRSGIKVRYVVYPTWAKALEAMEKGEIVLIPNLGIIAERAEQMDFTSSVETYDIVIFVRKTTTDIKDIEDLKGKEVAVVEINKGLFLMQERGGSRLQIYASQDEAFLSLISGKSDALVYPEPPINLLLRKAGLEDRIKIVGKPLLEIKRGIAVRKGNQELLKKLDDEVKTFIKTPRYEKIYAKWYGKPAPYWTAQRVAVFFGGGLAFAIVTLVVWRYLSLLRLNKELQAALTERKRLEEAIKAQTKRFETFFDNSITPLAFLDKNFNFIRVNKAYADADKKEISYFPGRNHFELYPSDAKTIFEEVVRTKTAFQAFAMPFVYPDHPDWGVTFWDWTLVPIIDNKGEVEFLVFSLVNVTERKRAEESLRKSEERYKRLLESITDYIYTVKVEHGCPVSTTHGIACVTITGYTPEEYEADPHLWYQMVYEGDREVAIEQANKVLSGEAVKPLEHRIIHKDGSIRWVRNTPVPRYDEQGRVVAYDGLITGITEQKKLEAQLRQSQKMEAVGQIAGGIAHDFNNILTAIIGYASLLQMKMREDDPLKVYIEPIITSTERAANLTQGLLAFSRKQISNPAPVNLNEIIKKVEKFLRRVIGEDIEFQAILSDKDLTVIADSGQIDQALMNLATNARDAMPGGGSLTIETGTMEIDEEYIKAHGYGKAGTYALISVTDSGVGMDEKTREKIFEPFFTTKEVGKGTGLGLSIVYGIVKQHSGYVNCYSEPGKGTTFRIYLPLNEAALKEVPPVEIIKPAGGTETILLAEDEENVRDITRLVLEEYGYKVIEAIDGEDAVNKFMENRDRIDLLLLDVIMPKMSGKEAYDRIRKIMPDIKVLFSSGYPADFIHRKEIDEQGLTFVAKPISPTLLVKKVREVLDK